MNDALCVPASVLEIVPPIAILDELYPLQVGDCADPLYVSVPFCVGKSIACATMTCNVAACGVVWLATGAADTVTVAFP